MIIAFSGLDGAGKSTQIALLKEYFDKTGIKNKVIWTRGGYSPGMETLKRSIRKLKPDVIPKPGKSLQRDQQFSNGAIRKIWLILALIDLIIQYAVLFRYRSLQGFVVIADRYMDDTGIDFELNFPKENVKNWCLWKLLKQLSPKPEIHFIALIPVEESLKRSIQKNEPFPDTKDVLRYRENTYKHIIESNKRVIELNGLDSIKVIHNKIIDIIKR